MTQRYHNPFAGVDLVVPIEQRDAYNRYCQSGGRAVIDHSPFPRMVDFWFTAMCIAARKQLKSEDLSNRETFKFNEGSIFDRDSWRVQAIMLVAIAVTGSVEIVGAPRRMVSIANGLAAAGEPYLLEMLEDDDQEAIWNLSDAIETLLRDHHSNI
jgi:hypothetical protein